MTHRVLVIPHGCGIGDFVNLQPLVRAIAAARPGAIIEVLGPPGLAALVPTGVWVVPRAAGIPYWSRPSASWISRRVGRLASARTLRFADSTTPARALAWTFTWYLRQAGYDEVFNLLDAFLRCDPGARWTRGYWNPRPEHVIDLLADRLEAEGIHVPSRARVPRLRADDVANIGRIDILVNADAGNNLKTLPAVRWAEVVQQISLTGLRVALLRGPEAPVARAVQGLLPSIEVVDSRSVDELLVRVATARCILSPDTGVLHIAAALGTPFVGLFGPTDPRFLGPYVTHGGTILHTPEVHEATCRACWLPQMLPVASCGRGYRYGCTAALQPDAIARAVVAAVTERSSPEWREMEPRMASAPDGTEDRAPG